MVVVFLAQNLAIAAFFPHFSRMRTDFSAAYLKREMRFLRAHPGTVFLGDSVLWGYRIPADATAVAVLDAHGCACENLSFKASSPPNYYALVLLMERAGVHPNAAVVEINQKVLNPADSAYQRLHPAVEELALPLMDSKDAALLTVATPAPMLYRQADAALSASWATYALRSDIRETLAGDVDTKPARRLTSAMFEGTYDVGPLDETNVGVQFLEKTADRLRADRIPTVAFLTPTNHALLHDFIDNREYAARGAFLERIMRARGVRVLDLDRAFRTADFIDEVHLTPEAQLRLADILAKALPK